jgi:hypothetical protein
MEFERLLLDYGASINDPNIYWRKDENAEYDVD